MRKLILLTIVGLVAALSPAVALAGQEKMSVCHLTGSGSFHLIRVAAPAYYNAHIFHGDGLPGDPVPGMDGYTFDEDCLPEAEIHVVAYTDIDPADGGYNAAVDVMIAMLIDGPGAAADGYPSDGDIVVTGRYPIDLNASSFADFNASGFAIFAIKGGTSTAMQVYTECCIHGWYNQLDMGLREYYVEARRHSPVAVFTTVRDYVDGTTADHMHVDLQSSSMPDIAVPHQELLRATDDPFVDVEFFNFIP